jgi:hypothetical protein
LQGCVPVRFSDRTLTALLGMTAMDYQRLSQDQQRDLFNKLYDADKTVHLICTMQCLPQYRVNITATDGCPLTRFDFLMFVLFQFSKRRSGKKSSLSADVRLMWISPKIII